MLHYGRGEGGKHPRVSRFIALIAKIAGRWGN
jgi:hypothetical protein